MSRSGGRALPLACVSVFLLGMASSQVGLSTSAFTSQLSRGADSWSADVVQPPTGLTADDACTGGSPVSVVGSTSASRAGGAVTLVVPATTQAGDLLVALVVNDGTSTAPSGFSLLHRVVNGANLEGTLYQRVADASDAGRSYAFPTSTGKASGSLLVARGGPGLATAADVAGVDSGKTTTPTAPSIDVPVAGTVLVSLFGLKQPDATYSPPPGMTEVVDYQGTAGTSNAAFTELLGATGPSGTRTATASTVAESTSHSLLLRPSAATEVHVAWSATSSTWATGYVVERDGVQVAALTDATATSWTDTAPTAASHTYAVRAVAGSWRSAPVSVTAAVGCQPTVQLTSPGPYASGTVALSATASSTLGIASVAVQRSPAGAGTWTTLCTDTSAPYGCSWVTTGDADGLYDLRAVATDGYGQTGTSAVVPTRVDNTGPTVTMTDPGSPLASPVTLASTVADSGSGVAGVVYQYALTGGSTWTTACTATAAPWTCSWDTSALVAAGYDLRAVATDAAGNAATSAVVANRQAGAVPSSAFASIGTPAGRTSSGSATATYPAGTEAGDLVLLVEANAANQAITTPSGWTLLSDQATSSPQQLRTTVWYRTAGAETSVTVSVNTNSSGASLWVVRYDRPAGAGPVSAGHTALREGTAAPSATLTPSPDVTTTGSAIVVGLTVVRAPNPLSLSAPQGFTLRGSAAGTGPVAPTLGVADQWTPAAATPASPTWSQSGTAAQWSWVAGAYR